MDFLYNDPKLKERRQELRNNMTRAELVLWERLRGRRFQGLKFRRQFGVDRFILDFYCPSKRIAIEVDGEIHKQSQARDEERDEIIAAANITVIRFWNDEVLKNIDLVLMRLSDAANASHPISPQTPPNISPPSPLL